MSDWKFMAIKMPTKATNEQIAEAILAWARQNKEEAEKAKKIKKEDAAE